MRRSHKGIKKNDLFILYRVQYLDACVVIPAKAGIQNLDASVRWHDKYLAACSEDYLLADPAMLSSAHAEENGSHMPPHKPAVF